MAATSHVSHQGAYCVPQRFGVSAILALTTLFAFVFATLRAFNAPPVLYLFFGTLAVSICLAQMIFGQVPRLSSILAGAVLLPFWVLVTAFVDERLAGMLEKGGIYFEFAAPIFIMGGFLALAGGFLGYLTGALLAGFFLLLDLAQSKGKASSPSPLSNEPHPADIASPPP